MSWLLDLIIKYPTRTKLKPRWDVHLAGGGNPDGGYAGAPLLLIAGLYGTSV